MIYIILLIISFSLTYLIKNYMIKKSLVATVNGVDAVSPVGTTGESATLSHKEHKECIEVAVATCKNTRVKVLAMTYHIPNFEHEDQIALSALSQLLSSGKSSILQKVLVDEKRKQFFCYCMVHIAGLMQIELFILRCCIKCSIHYILGKILNGTLHFAYIVWFL